MFDVHQRDVNDGWWSCRHHDLVQRPAELTTGYSWQYFMPVHWFLSISVKSSGVRISRGGETKGTRLVSACTKRHPDSMILFHASDRSKKDVAKISHEKETKQYTEVCPWFSHFTPWATTYLRFMNTALGRGSTWLRLGKLQFKSGDMLKHSRWIKIAFML